MNDENDVETYFSNLDNTWSSAKVKVTVGDSYDDIIRQFNERITILENQVKALTMAKILKE